MKLLTPFRYLNNLQDLNASILQQEGIEALLIDLDDTLVASGENFIHPEYVSWLEHLQQDGIHIAILSNGEPKHVAKWLDTLGLEGIALAGKPLPLAFARGLKLLRINKAFSANSAISINRSTCAMLGDQLFTDVLGANIYGLRCFLVKPLSPGKSHTRILRTLEKYSLKKMGY